MPRLVKAHGGAAARSVGGREGGGGEAVRRIGVTTSATQPRSAYFLRFRLRDPPAAF
jgi:hypothetical protein